jgi:hypothetical protein
VVHLRIKGYVHKHMTKQISLWHSLVKPLL